MTDDPFDEGVPRDGRGRPLIIPAKRGKPDLKGKLVAYTRASTLSGALDGAAGGLVKWHTRHAAVGVALRPHLAAMIAALGRNVNDYTPEDKRNLDAYIDQAHGLSGGNDKADYGTAVHAITEPGRDPFDEGNLDELRAAMNRDATAYARLLADLGLEVVDTEVFVVNDELLVAGTFDHAYRLTRDLVFGEVTLTAGTIVLGDKKTGSLHVSSHAIQLATYGRAKRYDHVTGERSALDVSPQWGLVLHIPRGEGKAAAVLIDLHAGYAAAKLAKAARDYVSAANVRKVGRKVAEVDLSAASSAPGIEGTIDPAEVIEPDTVETAPPADVVDAEVVETPAEPVAQYTPDGRKIGPDGFPADVTVGEAIGNLADAGLLDMKRPDVIHAAIEEATSGDALHAIWREHRTAWTEAHTAAAKVKAAKLAA